MIVTERYWCFGGKDSYPQGGLSDCLYRTDNYNKAIEKMEEYNRCDWLYVYDVKSDKIVWKSGWKTGIGENYSNFSFHEGRMKDD